MSEFDPNTHTVEDVQAYLDTADESERARVLEAERNGKARKGLVGDPTPTGPVDANVPATVPVVQNVVPDVSVPQDQVPGAAPADTTDPTVMVSSVPPKPGAEAVAAGVVNAVVPNTQLTEQARAQAAGGVVPEGGGRVEKYRTTKPNGQEVEVTHNLDTGATSVSPVS